jgi:hypothetical protein
VRSSSPFVLADEIVDNVFLKLFFEIQKVMLCADFSAHVTSVFDVFERTARLVESSYLLVRCVEKSHGYTNDFVPVSGE